MPFYDYKCTKCGFIFEIQKGMNEKIDAKCKKCAAPAERVFSIPTTKKSAKDILDSAGSEQSGSCSTCTSGVCSSCSGG